MHGEPHGHRGPGLLLLALLVGALVLAVTGAAADPPSTGATVHTTLTTAVAR